MAKIDKHKWDRRYAEGEHADRLDPNDWLLRALALAGIDNGKGGRALDVACGIGRNALHLSSLGFEVDAVDISSVGLEKAAALALERGLKVNWLEADLELPFDPPAVYDLIVMFRYVNMPLLERLGNCLKPGGWFICEEHMQTDEEVIGPKSTRFLLAPGALAKACGGLRIHHQEEGVFPTREMQRVALARVLAQRI